MAQPPDPRGARGPVFDRAMRQVAQTDVAGFCAWLGVPLESGEQAGTVLSAEFTQRTPRADLLVRISAQRLLHVEYQRRVEPDLAVRMLGYRAGLMATYPGSALSQRVIVLGDGVVHGIDDPTEGFALGIGVVYLRDCDPGPLLANPALAPLAVLAGGDRDQRAQSFAQAIRTITQVGGPQAAALRETAVILASIRLDTRTIKAIGRETGMTVESVADFYATTEIGQILMDRAAKQALEQGIEQGIEQGLEQGLEQGTVEMLAAMLRARFGDHPHLADAARHLAHAASRDDAVRAVLNAATLEALLP